ncbi:hypothetical protein BDZ89DRAFT_1072522 [Hymenopellis radicata]|nr:hypothetical protein BDZ89DRAFT_1072522 [Hymenopellis radicata]
MSPLGKDGPGFVNPRSFLCVGVHNPDGAPYIIAEQPSSVADRNDVACPS